jgi:predicted nucleotidyltransferase
MMIRPLEQKLPAVVEACQRFGVARLYVFGSSLRDDFRPGESDIDLLVEFPPDESYARVDAYFGLLDELRALLGNVDLVMTGAVKNPYIAQAIEDQKQLLYAA